MTAPLCTKPDPLFDVFSVEKVKWPVKGPDFNLIEHL